MKEETLKLIEQKLRDLFSQKKDWEKKFFKLSELSKDVFKELNKCYERIGRVEGKVDSITQKVNSYEDRFKRLDEIDEELDDRFIAHKNQVRVEMEKEVGEVKKMSAELDSLNETVDDWAVNLSNTYNRVQTETHSLFVFKILNRLLNLPDSKHEQIELEYQDLKAFIVKMVKENFWNPSLEYNVLNSVKAIKARGGYFEKTFSRFDQFLEKVKSNGESLGE